MQISGSLLNSKSLTDPLNICSSLFFISSNIHSKVQMMAVVPTFFQIRNFNETISKPNKRVCVCKWDVVVSKDNLPTFVSYSKHHTWEIHDNDSSVVTISTRARKSRRGLKALLHHVRCSNGLDFEHSKVSEKLSQVWECSTNEKQLRSLGSYFGRLQGVGDRKNLDSLKKMKVLDTGQFKAKKELQLLDAYFQKVDKADTGLHKHPLSSFDEQEEGKLVFTTSPSEDRVKDDELQIRHVKLSGMIHKSMPNKTQLQEEEVCDLYLIALVSINIAVFLFEVASPVKNSELQLFSLPSLYGAKINELILVGEWWRLVTPMFLHSGVLHVALSCWTLLTFGRQVCREYGPFTFFLIYVLGGVSGNLTSFLHTPDPTVGGTGPVFAMIGAWLSYQFQNKDVMTKDVSDKMFLKALVAAVISSILSNIGPIDEWTHTGAAFSGMLYGFLTSPIVEVNDASSSSSSRRGQEKGIKLVRKYANPCRSLAFFVLFIMGFISLVFFIQPPFHHFGLLSVLQL
ncbi:RHOMBOID-like protein 9, chloroplastic isoform X3 [Cucumis sativus]|uniref:RHOMBOID-like protein 9, chloroplastic isoform X3 n=1 Tax=Cucumis sativus TaxID=3659 RepID=UPI0012F4D5CF|nr:RHOMBOID-like protein 9, chloroplastic isoform X3 [Cucumis sativus]